MLEKFFRKARKTVEPSRPVLQFGRYSDNNKPVGKVSRWKESENLYREKKFTDSLDAFFDYLRDDEADNVIYERSGEEGRFQIYQGSKIVRGRFNAQSLEAEVTLAKMAQPSIPVMRRLLEMNFNLYYSRFALDRERLCMLFDTDIRSSSPNKLYYGLKELATKADKHDDLLVQDFASLEGMDSEHIAPMPAQEAEVKYAYLQSWIRSTLDTISALDADKFSGGIAYLLLNLIYRIDYLVSPEGRLLNDLEKIGSIYFKKDDRTVGEKNRDMAAEFEKILTRPREEIFASLFKSRFTFAIVSPQAYKTISDSIQNANQNVAWYRDNNYPFIAAQIAEYGLAYCQYSYSLPRPVTELYELLLLVNYPDFFSDMGYTFRLYDTVKLRFDQERIIRMIQDIVQTWKGKFSSLAFKTANLKFDSLAGFNYTYTNEIAQLNLDTKG
jgi:hypothetical protein